MITPLHSLGTTTPLFTTIELPDAAQEPALQGVVKPRVISSSMKPALRPGDYLKLEPADGLRIGDLVVFRHNGLLICHRVERMEDRQLHTRGDAGEGPAESIDRSAVVGRVTAIVRNGLCLSVPPPLPAQQRHLSRPDRPPSWISDKMRSLAGRSIARFMTLPLLGQLIRSSIFPFIMIDAMEPAPVRSLTGYIRQRTFRLSRIAHLQKYLAGQTDLARVTLIVRTGPVVLGTCRLAPWSLSLRPAAGPLDLSRDFHSLRRFSEGHRPL